MSPRTFLLANVLLLLGMGSSCLLMVMSAENNRAVRNQLRDFVAPGMQILTRTLELGRWATTQGDTVQQSSDKAAATSPDLDRLQREVVTLKTLLKQKQSPQWQTAATARLFQPELISARRLLPDQETRWRSGQWLDVGRQQKIAEQDWILSAELPLIDLGADHQLQPDHLLLAGRQVIGQIDQVGRWSSTYRTVTHAEFRCPATILNVETGQRNDRAAGSLHGLGKETCELKYIENTIPVSPGDLVVLSDPQRRFDVPLFLGTVLSARVLQNSPFWEIEVAPAPLAEHEKQVQIITERVNPARLLAN